MEAASVGDLLVEASAEPRLPEVHSQRLDERPLRDHGSHGKTFLPRLLPSSLIGNCSAAEQLIDEIARWPDLNEVLFEEAGWRSQTGGLEALAAARTLGHAGRFSFHPASPLARQIVEHLLNNHSGLCFTDLRGRTWAVQSSSNDDADVGAMNALSLGYSGAINQGRNVASRSASAAQVIQAACDQDLRKAVELLIWLTCEVAAHGSLGFTFEPVVLLNAIGLQRDTYDGSLDELNGVLSVAVAIKLSLVRLPPGRWQLLLLREVPALRLTWLRTNLIHVQVSELLQPTLNHFFNSVLPKSAHF